MNIDWCAISDFQLAMMLWPTLPQEKTKILFGDLNFQKFSPRENLQNGDICLVNTDDNIVIDELAYMKIQKYLCVAHNLTKKVEKAGNEFTKKVLIEEDRTNIKINSQKEYKSFLLPLISAVKARQGYTKDYIRNMGIVEFFDEVSRLQIIVNTDALLHGAYSGMMDSSKINRSEFDWMRSIEQTNKQGAMSLNQSNK